MLVTLTSGSHCIIYIYIFTVIWATVVTCKIWHVFYTSAFLMCPVTAPVRCTHTSPAELFVYNSPQSKQSQYFIDASFDLTGFVLRLFFFYITLLVVGRRAGLTDLTLLVFRDARRFFLQRASLRGVSVSTADFLHCRFGVYGDARGWALTDSGENSTDTFSNNLTGWERLLW